MNIQRKSNEASFYLFRVCMRLYITPFALRTPPACGTIFEDPLKIYGKLFENLLQNLSKSIEIYNVLCFPI